MNKIFWRMGIYCLIALARQSDADEVRVDSAGSISLVLWDESSDVNPYTLGNPAGLAYLPSGTRLDFRLPWFSTTNTSGSNFWNQFGISPGIDPYFFNFSDFTSPVNAMAGYQYQGLIYVPKDDWGFQVAGGYEDENYLPPSFPNKENFQDGNESVQAAHNFGPLAFGAGLQFSDSQSSSASYPQTISGSSSVLKTGFLANIPLSGGGKPSWLLTGTSLSVNISPFQTDDYFSLNAGTQNYLTVQKTSTILIEPCAFLEVPGSFQGGVVLDINENSQTDTISENSTVIQPTYTEQTGTGMSFAALYKWKIALSPPKDPHPLTFNNGILLETGSFDSTEFTFGGTVPYTFQMTSFSLQAGLGFEREGNFTLGLQVDSLGTVGTEQLSSGVLDQYYDESISHITLGGEKCLSPDWALRMGLTFVEDQNLAVPGSETAGEGFFSLFPGQQVTGVMVTTGAGYEDKGLKIDGMVWFEQPESTGTGFTGPEYAYTIMGAQLAFGLVL